MSYASDSHLVVIPTYNEIDNIEEFIIQISNFDVSVLIVDDNSPDGTGKVVEDITKINKKINLMKRNEKLGLGSAYRDGFKWGLDKGYSYLLEMDADFSHRFEDLVKILEASSSADMIIGSRYIEEGGSIGWDTRRKMLSSFANKLSKFLLKTKINDMTSGFRCYSNKALFEISYATTKSDGYAFQVEMSARAVQKQLSIKEVPIIFNERRLGNSKMSKKIVYEAFLYLVKNGYTTREDVPTGFKIVGKVAYMSLNKRLYPFRYDIGQIIKDKKPKVSTVACVIGEGDYKFGLKKLETIAGIKD